MIFTTSEFCRHSGLGNKLFPWSRAKILSKEFGAIMLEQNWVSIRGAAVTRGGIDYTKVFGKIYLFDNFKDDNDEISKLIWKLKYKYNCDLIYVTNLKEALEYLKYENKLIVFRWNTDHFFTDLELFRNLIKNSLYKITNPKSFNKILFDEPFIGINIRLGNDFIDQNSKEVGYKKTNIEWYLDNISMIRRLYGNLPIQVVSDGGQKQLEVFKKIDNLEIRNNNKAIEDLLFLTQAQVFLGSGNSSFSAWASFLGNMPTYFSSETSFSSFKLKNVLII
jgi:hypothetical protein